MQKRGNDSGVSQYHLQLAALLHAVAQPPPLLPEADVAALANELSGETAKRNLEGLARFHRQRGSQGFHSAAELVAERESHLVGFAEVWLGIDCPGFVEAPAALSA